MCWEVCTHIRCWCNTIIKSTCKTISLFKEVMKIFEVEDFYPVTYVPSTSFIIHLPKCDVIFERYVKLYVVNWSDIFSNFVTKGIYTKADKHRAKLVYKLMHNSIPPSSIISIFGLPALTNTYICRAYIIFGIMPEHFRSRLNPGLFLGHLLMTHWSWMTRLNIFINILFI